MKTILTVLAALTCTAAIATKPALAQYYERQYERPPGYDPGYDQNRPPPGYYPDRDRPPPGYDPDRERDDRYRGRPDRNRYGQRRRVALGRQCEVFLRTDYGQQRLVCPIIRAKPVGEDCACPTLPNGSNGPLGPYVGGQTIP